MPRRGAVPQRPDARAGAASEGGRRLLRAGTLQLDDLVLTLDQVAGVRAERGRVRLLLHTGDELVSRPLGDSRRSLRPSVARSSG